MYTHCRIEPSVGLDANTTFTILLLYGLRGTSFDVRHPRRKTPDSAMLIISSRCLELDSSWTGPVTLVGIPCDPKPPLERISLIS